MSLADLQQIEARAVMGTYARNPVEFVRGEGTRLWDDAGDEYLDPTVLLSGDGGPPPPMRCAPPGGPSPRCTPTGMSSSSARAKYAS